VLALIVPPQCEVGLEINTRGAACLSACLLACLPALSLSPFKASATAASCIDQPVAIAVAVGVGVCATVASASSMRAARSGLNPTHSSYLWESQNRIFFSKASFALQKNLADARRVSELQIIYKTQLKWPFLAELSSAFLLRPLRALIEARKAKLPISDVFVSLYGNSHLTRRSDR